MLPRRSLAEYDWARLVVLPATAPRERGAPIVRALHAGLDSLDLEPDVVVNVDADVTMEPGLLRAAARRVCARSVAGHRERERAGSSDDGVWRQRFVTGGTVWGATRAYRWACLQDVLPLEARHGWDGIDQLKARAQGWTTKTLTDLPFRHHRAEGQHDGSTWNHWLSNGDTAYFMGYRPWYLLARMLHQTCGTTRRPSRCFLAMRPRPFGAPRGWRILRPALFFVEIRASATSFIADERP